MRFMIPVFFSKDTAYYSFIPSCFNHGSSTYDQIVIGIKTTRKKLIFNVELLYINMVILYTFISEEKHLFFLDRYMSGFSPETQQAILRYRRWQDAQLSLLGKVLLQYGLRAYYNISDIETGLLPNRKPYLKDHHLHFNISHSKDLVVCAIAEYPLGIDVEFNDPKISYQDFIFQMTDRELLEIQNADDKIKGFFTYWTRKEAVIKAHGDGMMIPLESFEIANNECIIEGEKFFTREIFIHEGYHGYIASSDREIKKAVPLFKHWEEAVL